MAGKLHDEFMRVLGTLGHTFGMEASPASPSHGVQPAGVSLDSSGKATVAPTPAAPKVPPRAK